MISDQSGTDHDLLLSKIQLRNFKVTLEKNSVVIGAVIADEESHYIRESLRYVLKRFIQLYSRNLSQGVIVKADFYGYQAEAHHIFGRLTREAIIDLLYQNLTSATKKQNIGICVYIYKVNGILGVKNIERRNIPSLFPIDYIEHDTVRVKKVKGQKIVVTRQNRIVVAITGKNIQKMTKRVEKFLGQSKELIKSLHSFIHIDTDTITTFSAVKQTPTREVSPPVYSGDIGISTSRGRKTITAKSEKRFKPRKTAQKSSTSMTTILSIVIGAFFLVIILGTIGLGFIMKNSPFFVEVHDFSWELPNEMKAHLDISPHVMNEEPVSGSTPIPGPTKRIYQLTANWATMIPTLDNIVDENEWNEATAIYFNIEDSYRYLSNISIYALSDQLYFYFRIDFSVLIPANNNISVISRELSIQFTDYDIDDMVDFRLKVIEDDLEWSEGGVISKAIPDYKIMEMIQPSELTSFSNNDSTKEDESKTIGEQEKLPVNVSKKLEDIYSFEIVNPMNGTTIKGIVLIQAQLTGFDLSQWKVIDTVLIVDFIEFPNSTISETIVTDANTANNSQFQPVDELIITLSWDSNFIKPGARVVSVRTRLLNIMDNSRYIQINSFPVILIKSQVLIVNKLKEEAIITPNISEINHNLHIPVLIAIFVSQIMVFYSKKSRSEYSLEQRGKGDEN